MSSAEPLSKESQMPLSLVSRNSTVECPSTNLDGDAIGQLVASLIATHLSDLYQIRQDPTARCVSVQHLPKDIKATVEYEARFLVNRQDTTLRNAAVWKAAESMALTQYAGPWEKLPTGIQNRYYHFALTCLQTYIAVLDGSHAPLTVRDCAAAAVARQKGGGE